jgi:hypothetical protein
MRPTLTLEPDVSDRIKSMLKESSLSQKQLINDLLRRGIDEYSKDKHKGPLYKRGQQPGGLSIWYDRLRYFNLCVRYQFVGEWLSLEKVFIPQPGHNH